METYKKPVVASQNDKNDAFPIMPIAFVTRKLLGGDDFHVEKSLTPRKK